MLRVTVVWVVAAIACGCGGPSHETELAGVPDANTATATSDKAQAVTVGIAGPPRQNKIMRMSVTDGGYAATGPAAPAGLRNYTVALKGTSRSRNEVAIEVATFVFAQNERGCISRPVAGAAWLAHPFGATMVLSADKPAEGQLGFLVPADTQRIRVLIAPAGAGGLIVPVGDDFDPSWPAPIQTIEDGSTLRVFVLPIAAVPADFPAPAAGREQVVMDYVIENLKSEQGIEFTTSQQLRLIDPDGTFLQASDLTNQIGCRLDDGDVIPPGQSRRFLVAYDVPAGMPRRLQYRGFEVDEINVDLE